MKKIVLAFGALTFILTGCSQTHLKSSHHEEHKKHWNYEDNGPTHWREFSKTCGIGTHQSPVNIITGKTISMNHEYDLSMHEDITSNASIVDNGHSIKVTPEKSGTITLNGETFKLLQFHFHGKSEHTIDGKRYDMVAHLVHQNPKTKQLAVVAVFFTEGKASPILDTIINNIGSSAKIDPQALLPKDDADYYHYIGSLTTPPCSENVQWYLLKTPKTASAKQIESFRKYYVDNERPTQSLNDRVVEVN